MCSILSLRVYEKRKNNERGRLKSAHAGPRVTMPGFEF